MKRIGTILTIIAILGLSSGCSKNKQEIEGLNTNIVKYEYIDIIEKNLFDELFQVNITSEGLILAQGEIEEENMFPFKKHVLIDGDGKIIKELDIDEKHSASSVHTLNSKDHICFISNYPARYLAIYDLNGNLISETEKVEIDDTIFEDEDRIRKIVSYNNDLIYALRDSGTIEIIDENCITKDIIEIEDSKILDLDIDNNNNLILLVQGDVENQIIIYDTKNKKELYKVDQDSYSNFDELEYDFDGVAYDKERNVIYGISNNRVFESKRKIIDGLHNLREMTLFYCHLP